MTTLEDKIKAKADALKTQLSSASIQGALQSFQNRVTARWSSRRLWVTVLPIIAAVFFLRGHLSEILTVVIPSAVTLIKWYILSVCVTDAVNAICDTWNRNVLAGHVIAQPAATQPSKAEVVGKVEIQEYES